MERQGRLGRREVLRRGLSVGIAALGLDALAACAPPRESAPATATALPPPETTNIRLAFTWCDPSYWMADAFLHDEGFSSVSVAPAPYAGRLVVQGEADIGITFAQTLVSFVDAGQPLVALAGIHAGCQELWVRPGIGTISDLRSKTVAVGAKTFTFDNKTSADTTYGVYASLLAHVGIKPGAVDFVEIGANASLLDAFLEGRSDAFLASAEAGALLHANPKNPGNLILDTTMDKPWSQLLCCLVIANRDWARTHPVATKRATRALLRAADAVAKDRHAAARVAIERGLNKAYPAVTEQVVYDTIKDLPFDWREYEPEETVRFYALRLSDAKLIGKTPQQIIYEGMDLAYFRQLRTELKT